MTRGLRILSFIFILLLTVDVATTAACGMYIPKEGDSGIVQERALVRWLDGTEDIVMELSVQGNAKEAAWILPVPAPAQARLADPKLFDALQEFTKPETQVQVVYGEGSMAPAGGAALLSAVTVLGRQSLGPFEVTSLAATDANALSDWLAKNGYKFPAGLADVLRYYVDNGWSYVAIRLKPGQADAALQGALDPLWITFKSAKIVYPMRAAAMATGRLPVFLYVLAEHRVQRDNPAAYGVNKLSFANWVKPAELGQDSPLAPFVTKQLFLTKHEVYVPDMKQVNSDIEFTFDANDQPFRDVEIHYEYRESTWGKLRSACPIAALPLMIAGVAVIVAQRKSYTATKV